MVTRLFLDYETRSHIKLKACGLDRYLKDNSTQPLMLAYALNDDDPKLWKIWLGEEMPAELRAALLDPTVMLGAWNYNFEKDCTEYQIGIKIPQARWFDPSVLCAYMSLPIGLDRASKALGISEKKIHQIGPKRGIKMFCEPSKSTKKMIKNGAEPTYYKDWNSHPEEWAQFCDYCLQDVRAEREAWHAAVALNCPMTDEEFRIWQLDQRMNKRGVNIDQDYVNNAKKLAEAEANEILAEIKAHTGLDNPNSRDQLLGWLTERGYSYDSLDKEHLEEALKHKTLKPLVRQILELKQKLGGSAYKKLEAILDRMGIDGRLRDQFIYHGAHTGRWCIAEGSMIRVKTEHGAVTEKPIEQVLISDLVWDGDFWVRHDGVVDSGDKLVIERDNVCATADHEVWLNSTEKVPLRDAMTIWRGTPTPYTIYRITSPSGKYYIGLTRSSLKTRWQQHRHRAKTTTHNHPFLNAIRKYGMDFNVETIDIAADKHAAQLLEMSYIALAPKDKLYNVSSGGEADGEEGSAMFWGRLNANLAQRTEYLQKLSDVKKSQDWSNYEEMTAAALQWRKRNPKTAYYQSRRNCRITNAERPPRKSDSRPLIEKLRWKHDRAKACSLSVSTVWATRTPEQKEAICAKIKAAHLRRNEGLSLEARQKMTATARRVHVEKARLKHENL